MPWQCPQLQCDTDRGEKRQIESPVTVSKIKANSDTRISVQSKKQNATLCSVGDLTLLSDFTGVDEKPFKCRSFSDSVIPAPILKVWVTWFM